MAMLARNIGLRVDAFKRENCRGLLALRQVARRKSRDKMHDCCIAALLCVTTVAEKQP
jgi:hypothetical protein